MRKLHNFLKLVAMSNQCSSFSHTCRRFSSGHIDGEMNDNKVSIILTVVTTILSCYILGKLFSKLRHIKISALFVYFKGFIARKTATEDPYI